MFANAIPQSPSVKDKRMARDLRREGFHSDAHRGFVRDGDGTARFSVDDAVWIALCTMELDEAG